ncbi:hypothetical protein [Paenibacillus dendrobii]|uniref:hypothetical protein n=1 Tax=Paenibacillus dendrobii TaxID=2691084 RepID=UPI001F468021|nr:hypothetical protein [Paenibacillus dendrobii]
MQADKITSTVRETVYSELTDDRAASQGSIASLLVNSLDISSTSLQNGKKADKGSYTK